MEMEDFSKGTSISERWRDVLLGDSLRFHPGPDPFSLASFPSPSFFFLAHSKGGESARVKGRGTYGSTVAGFDESLPHSHFSASVGHR